MNVGIFGIGAIGSVISFSLNDDVTTHYFNRSPKSKIRLKFQEQLLEQQLKLSEVHSSYPLDWLLICLKEYQYHNALEDLGQLITPNTKVAVIRNGINLKDHILKFTNESNILECMINAPTQPNELGNYELFSFPKITISEIPVAKQFSGLFNNSRITINRTQEFKTENWKKLIESSSLGAVMCIANENSIVFKEEKYLQLYRELVLEGIKIGVQDGARIESNFIDILLNKLISYGDIKGSSMLTDKRLGRRIEVNAKNGAIVNAARNLGIEAPLHEQMVTELKK